MSLALLLGLTNPNSSRYKMRSRSWARSSQQSKEAVRFTSMDQTSASYAPFSRATDLRTDWRDTRRARSAFGEAITSMFMMLRDGRSRACLRGEVEMIRDVSVPKKIFLALISLGVLYIFFGFSRQYTVQYVCNGIYTNEYHGSKEKKEGG